MTKPENKKLTEKQEAFLDALFDEENLFDYKLAAIKAGYSDSSKPTGIARGLSTEILERTEHYLAMHAPKSAVKIVQLLDDPTKRGAKQILDSAKEVLDRAGIVKKQQMEVQTTAPTAILIMPEKNED